MARHSMAQRAAIALNKKKARSRPKAAKGKRKSTFMNGHNMDHNGDGKITGIDFKIMNKAKKRQKRGTTRGTSTSV